MIENLALTLIVVSLLLDVLIFLTLKSKNITRFLVFSNVLLISSSASLLLFSEFSIFSFMIMLLGIFRIVNVGRVIEYRLNIKELVHKYIRSAVVLDFLTVILLFMFFYGGLSISLSVLLLFSLTSATILFINTIISLYRWSKEIKIEDKSELPTISICIPARNETQDLPECIESMLASNYPKLEIIVLDDCSHDKTPAIIKEYAHQGVRFIKGEEPDEDWLAKNQAMNKLFDEAKGEIIIYAGVDVRFSKDTVRQISGYLQNGFDMISILPKRSGNHELSVFIQPLRYWWELSVPRFFGGRPPVLSTCWAIKKSTLKSLGEFDSFRKSVQPESHFASRLKKAYRFIISGNRLGVTSVKPAREQYDTAIRTRYPQTKRQVESTFILLSLELLIFFTPLFGLIYGLIKNDSTVVFLSVLTMLLLIAINLIISLLTVKKTWIFGVFTLPFLLAEEWLILIRSMLAYEFGTVMWKDRNICLPMFQVEKKLPKLD